MNLMQGNTYRMPIKLIMRGVALSPEDVSLIEFTLGKIVKRYPDEIFYENGSFVLPLSQKETFILDGVIQYQARVLFADGETVKSTRVMKGNVRASISKEVLS